MALTQVASGLIASVSGASLTGTQTIPRGTLPTGSVLQVVQATTISSTTSSSTSYVAIANLTASITPSSSSSKVLILVNSHIYTSGANVESAITIYRNSSDLSTGGTGFTDAYTGGSDLIVPFSMMYLDSPATTSSTTYAAYFKRTQGTTSMVANLRGCLSSVILMEIAA
jgi:hypothetical protein